MSPKAAIQPRIRRRRYRWWTRWPIAIWLAIMWSLLWGEPSIPNLINGFLIGIFVLWLLPMPRVGFEGRVWLPGVIYLLAGFVWDVLVAAVNLAWYAISPRRTPHGAIIRVQLRSHSDVLLTITAQFTSLVPGSVVVEAHRLTGLVYVHVFDAEISRGIDAAKATVIEQERRIMYALASDAELAAAGYPPRGWLRIRKELGPQHLTEREQTELQRDGVQRDGVGLDDYPRDITSEGGQQQ